VTALDLVTAARNRLLADEPPSAADRRLAVLALDELRGHLTRRQASRLRQASLAERNRLIRQLAELYTGRPRTRALQLLADARRYAASSWPRDRGCVTCPPRLRGTKQELLWRAMKAHPLFPRLRQLQNILQ
jgi:hypothetical protein